LDCAFQINFLSALVFRTVAPLVLVLVMLILGKRALHHGYEAIAYLLSNGGVLVVFLVYPSVTMRIFQFFQIHTFDGTYGRFLIADYSVDVDSVAYNALTPFVIAMMAVWPFGVPLGIAILMWRQREPLLEIRRRERIMREVYTDERWAEYLASHPSAADRLDTANTGTPEVEGYLWSLTESYRGTVFYFEVLEYLIQKLTLVGLIVFFNPGSLEQLTLGLVVCFSYCMLCSYLMPFGSSTDNLMAVATQFSLFIVMLSAVIVEHGGAVVPQGVVTILTIAAFVPAGLMLALTFQTACNELDLDPCGMLCRPIARVADRIVHRVGGLSPGQIPSISVEAPVGAKAIEMSSTHSTTELRT